MKFFIALTLSLMSLSAMALPILVEPYDDIQHRANILYGDHEDNNKGYYIPGNGQIFMGYGEPMFGLKGGFVTGYFSITPHDALDIRLLLAQEYNSDIWIMPIKHKFYDFKETAGMFENVFDYNQEDKVDFGHAFNAVLSEKGKKELPELLKTKTETMNLFSICYEVEGISPYFGGSITLNPSLVFRHFLSRFKTKDEFSRAELKTEIQTLIQQGSISIKDFSGDAHMPDYEAVAVDIVISKMLQKDPETRKFTLNLKNKNTDRLETIELKGRKTIERVICSDVGIKDLKNYPHLIEI